MVNLTYLLIGAVATAIGAINIVHPLFKFERFMARRFSLWAFFPESWYAMKERITGAVMAAAGIAIMIASFFT